MFYEPDKRNHGLGGDPFKAIVAPRPIGWITSMDAKGNVNLAPYSFFNGVHSRPAMVMFASEGRKDSVSNIAETGEFVCNLATWDLREAMNATSAPFQHGVNEMERAGLEARAVEAGEAAARGREPLRARMQAGADRQHRRGPRRAGRPARSSSATCSASTSTSASSSTAASTPPR